jgi:hypothetical protein
MKQGRTCSPDHDINVLAVGYTIVPAGLRKADRYSVLPIFKMSIRKGPSCGVKKEQFPGSVELLGVRAVGMFE